MKAYVYEIRNKINNKVYIGKTINPKERWSDHRKLAKVGKEKCGGFSVVHRAIAKYGVDNFEFNIIEEFETEKEALDFETIVIILAASNKRNYGYNCNLGGHGGMSPSEETRQKMIEAANTPAAKLARSIGTKKAFENNPQLIIDAAERWKGNTLRRGTTLTEEHKKKCSIALSGRVFTEEHKKNLGASQEGSKSVKAKLNEDDVIEILSLYKTGNYTQRALAIKYDIHFGTLNDIIMNKTWRHVSRS